MDRDYTYRILGCVYEVYNQLGPGLLKSIYEKAMMRELRLNGFDVRSQVQVPVHYKGEQLCHDLRLDLIVDNKVILELKSVIDYRKLFEKQLYTYLRLMDCELGYVVNFNTENIRDSIYSVVNRHSTTNPKTRNPINPYPEDNHPIILSSVELKKSVE